MSSEEKIDKILRHVEKLDRGMYGDPDNGVKGMVKENQDQENRIIKLEESQKRVRYWIAGASSTIPALLYAIAKKIGI